MLDIKIIGIVSVLILLILGYFVYVLYNDVVFLRKELNEVKSVEHWGYEENGDEEEQEYEDEADEEDDAEEDEKLERHLNTFLYQQEVSLPTIQEVEEPVVEEVEVLPEIEAPQVKKRKTKAK
jgi:hypothetical protein